MIFSNLNDSKIIVIFLMLKQTDFCFKIALKVI